MNVPIDACAGGEGVVIPREEFAGEPGRGHFLKNRVEDEGEEDFVDVEGERSEVEGVGVRGDEIMQELRAGDWVAHVEDGLEFLLDPRDVRSRDVKD